jgi:hypothetical protein
LANHTETHLPFLSNPLNRRLRTLLHASLARLVFLQPGEEVEKAFGEFVAPLVQVGKIERGIYLCMVGG